MIPLNVGGLVNSAGAFRMSHRALVILLPQRFNIDGQEFATMPPFYDI